VRPTHLSFSPQYPLWTDGASKRRWIHIPAGTWVDASDPDAWRFPVGTRIWKEFAFAGRRVETRFMELGADGSWRYATYLWLADGSDALLAPSQGVPDGVPVGGPARHAIPGEADCRACHEGRRSPVLGFAALQLSSDRDPGAPHAAAEPGDVDLSELVERGIVRGLPAEMVARPPRIEAATPAARAALGYLHGNCGGCHNAEGPLAALGLVLAHSVADPAASAVLASTVGRASRFRASGSSAELRIAPGDAGASVLSLRMRSRDPLLQMPPIGSLAVDHAAVALIESWISDHLAAPGAALDKAKEQ
jgi:hypothetical protein